MFGGERWLKFADRKSEVERGRSVVVAVICVISEMHGFGGRYPSTPYPWHDENATLHTLINKLNFARILIPLI